MVSVIVLLFAWQITGTVMYLVLIRRLFARLADHHRDVWRTLGAPSLFANNTPSNNVLVWRYLWRRSFLSLGVPEDVELATRVRGLLLVLCLTFAILVASLLTVLFNARVS